MSNPFIQIGVVTGFEITENRSGEQKVVMLQVALSEETDSQSVELYNPVGKTGVPPIDSAVLVLTVAEGFKIAIAINDGLDVTELAEGECLSYSQDEDGIRRTEILQKANGELELKSVDGLEATQAAVKLDNDGDVTINEGTDWAVQFTALKSAFDQLKNDLNTFITTTFNTHTHSYLPGPGAATPTAVPVPTGSSSSADMSGAKIDSIKVP